MALHVGRRTTRALSTGVGLEAQGYFSPHPSVTFAVPRDLRPARYEVLYCNVGCTHGIGDLMGGWVTVSEETDPIPLREWPLSEPKIANLADDAVLVGPDYEVTAAEVTSGTVSQAPNGDLVRTARAPTPEPLVAGGTVSVPRTVPLAIPVTGSSVR